MNVLSLSYTKTIFQDAILGQKNQIPSQEIKEQSPLVLVCNCRNMDPRLILTLKNIILRSSPLL